MYEDGMIPLGTKIEEVEKKTYKFSDEPLNQSIDELLDEVIKEQGKSLKKALSDLKFTGQTETMLRILVYIIMMKM